MYEFEGDTGHSTGEEGPQALYTWVSRSMLAAW